MGIRYEQDTPLKEYMGVYQIPATLADCVEQYRLDCIQNVDQNAKISELDYSVIIEPGQQGYDNAFALYDPLGYFGDTTLSVLPPKPTASIPPLPSTLVRESVALSSLAEAHYLRLGKRLGETSDELVSNLASGVAAAYFDFGFKPRGREDLIAYLAYNSAVSPVSRVLSNHPEKWEHRRREIALPDMVERRRRDFVQLFKDYGRPLQDYEIECVSDDVLVEYATDMRVYILELNRHVTFCKKCGLRMLTINQQIMAPSTALVM
jgi:hypothetical protein